MYDSGQRARATAAAVSKVVSSPVMPTLVDRKHALVDAWDHAEFWKKELVEPCFIYMVRSGSAVKVGKANDVYSRINGLQTGNPVKLELLHVVPGDHELETRIHKLLRKDRVHGEWFDGPNVERVLELVAELAAKILAAYGGDGVAPAWKGHIRWPVWTTYHPRKRKSAPVTVRYVQPDPVPEDVAQDRLKAAWMRPRRKGDFHHGGVSPTSGSIS